VECALIKERTGQILCFIFGAVTATYLGAKPVSDYFLFDACSAFRTSHPIPAGLPSWLNATFVRSSLSEFLITTECIMNRSASPSILWASLEALFSLFTLAVAGGQVYVTLYDWIMKLRREEQ
jgi:hypothetical protein